MKLTPAAADWLTPRRFAALLVLLVFVSWPQVFLGLQCFVYRDFGYFTYPVAQFQRDCFWRGELPLWNPLNCSGIPFLAQWNTAALYPPSLFYLLLPLPWSLGVFQILHLLLGGLGMFLLARRWTGNAFAAAVAGVVFAFSGLNQNCLMWVSNLAALAWMPWVIWRVELAAREGGSQIAIAALVGAMQMLSGAPEIIALTWLVAAMPVLGLGVKSFCRFALVVAVVAALSAAQLLPFLDLLAHSHRTENFTGDSWSLPLSGAVNFFAPLFRAHPSYHGVYLQTAQQWTASYYLGGATLVLAALAVFRVRSRRVFWLAALAVLGLVLALGNAGGIYGLLRHVPGLGVMRYPVKFIVLPVFILPLLAAFALAGGGEDQPRKFRNQVAFLWLALLVSAIAALGFAWKFPLPECDWSATWRNTAVRAIFFTAILGGLVLMRQNLRASLRRWLPWVLLVVVWFDLLTHAPRQQTINADNFSAPWPRVPAPPRWGEGRVWNPPAAEAELTRFRVENPATSFVSRRWALVENCNLIEGVPKVDGFFSLRLREELEVFALLTCASNGYPARLADFLGVSQVNAAADVFTWVARPTALPLVTAGQQPVFAGREATLQKLAGLDFDPRREVCLPSEAKAFITATNANAKISGVKFSSRRVAVKVQADAPALVVVAQSFYHCWRGSVDGRPARVWRANHNFQAVEIPAGAHEMELVYEDRRFELGAVISLVTLAGCVACFFRPPWKRNAAALNRNS